MPANVTRESRAFLHELDLVRVVTALSVIAVHVTAFTVIFNTTKFGADVQNAAVSALHFTREVFLSLTALVMVHNYTKRPLKLSSFWRKRGIGVVVPYVIWSLVYVYFNVPHTPLGDWVHTAIVDILTGNASYQLYYILLTIEFYLALPLLLWFVRRYRQHPWRVLGASLVFQLALMYVDFNYVEAGPFASTHFGQWLSTYQWRLLPEYQFYVMIGAFAALYLDELRAFVLRHSAGVVLGLVAGTSALWIRYAMSVGVEHQSTDYATQVFQPVMVFYSLTTTLFLYWLGVAWASRRTKKGMPHGHRIVRLLSDSSFGIYLIHAFILNDVLTFVAPSLLIGWPVAIRVFGVWFIVAAVTTSICVVLLYTPGMSRLIGRPSLLPPDFGPRLWARIRTRQVPLLRPAAQAHASSFGASPTHIPQGHANAVEEIARADD